MHPLDNPSTAAADFMNEANWQGVDDVPTVNSHNLVESGGVVKEEIAMFGLKSTLSYNLANNTTKTTAILLKQNNVIKIVIYASILPSVGNFILYNAVGSSYATIVAIPVSNLTGGYAVYYNPLADGRLSLRLNNTPSGESFSSSFLLKIYEIDRDLSLQKIESDTTYLSLAQNGDGYLFDVNGYFKVDTKDIATTTGYKCCIINRCKQGQKFVINASFGRYDGGIVNELPDDGSSVVTSNISPMSGYVYTVTKDCTLYINTNSSYSNYSVKPYIVKESDIINWIAAEAFQYSSIVQNSTGVVSASITYPDGVTGSMNVTYTNNLPTSVSYTYKADTYLQSISYNNDASINNTTIVKQ